MIMFTIKKGFIINQGSSVNLLYYYFSYIFFVVVIIQSDEADDDDVFSLLTLFFEGRIEGMIENALESP